MDLFVLIENFNSILRAFRGAAKLSFLSSFLPFLRLSNYLIWDCSRIFSSSSFLFAFNFCLCYVPYPLRVSFFHVLICMITCTCFSLFSFSSLCSPLSALGLQLPIFLTLYLFCSYYIVMPFLPFFFCLFSYAFVRQTPFMFAYHVFSIVPYILV